MPKRPVPEGYYTSSQVAGVLGCSVTMVYNYEKDKRIKPRVLPPGKKQGYFDKGNIDSYARRLKRFYEGTKLHFVKATAEAQQDEFDLAALNFGEGTHRFDGYRRELLEKNADMVYYLYDQKNIAASIDIVPLDAEGITKFKVGERGWLLGEHVTPFAGKVNLIIIDMLTTPLVPRNQREIYAQILLRNMQRVFAEWAYQGVEIESIHACGGTPDGERILQHATFRFMGEPKQGRRIYGLIVNETDWVGLKPYKDALVRYKQEHNAA